MNRFTLILTQGLAAMVASTALAHSDILLTRAGNTIVTGGYDFDAAPGEEVIPAPLRVFGYDFGEIPGQPHFAEDPGFISLAGTFVSGTSFSFSVLDDLKFWTGSNFGPVPGNESLLIERGSSSMTVGTGEILPKAGLILGTASSAPTGQQLHEHLSVTLHGPNGDFSPPGTDGIYLLTLSLHGTGGLLESDPIWIVYNHGADEAEHDVAIDWAQANLVPEPTSMIMLALGGFALTRRPWKRTQS